MKITIYAAINGAFVIEKSAGDTSELYACMGFDELVDLLGTFVDAPKKKDRTRKKEESKELSDGEDDEKYYEERYKKLEAAIAAAAKNRRRENQEDTEL